MKTNFTLLFAFLIFLQSSCDRNDNGSIDPINQLPPPTQTGEYTFGCLINGEPFSVTSSSDIGSVYQGGLLQLSAIINRTNFSQSIGFNLADPLVENQEYTFDNSSYKAGYGRITNNESCIYEYKDTYVGSITITKLEKTNYIIAGIFSFSTKIDGCDDISITNGRFDVKYAP